MKHIIILKKKKLNSITTILFNHDSKFRSKKFLFPKLIKAFKEKNIKYINKIYSYDISGDFSSAEDICKGIFKLSIINTKQDKIILSSGKRTYVNKIIKKLNRIYNYQLNKKIKNKNFKFIGNSKYAKKLINFKPTKNFNNVIIKNFF